MALASAPDGARRRGGRSLRLGPRRVRQLAFADRDPGRLERTLIAPVRLDLEDLDVADPHCMGPSGFEWDPTCRCAPPPVDEKHDDLALLGDLFDLHRVVVRRRAVGLEQVLTVTLALGIAPSPRAGSGAE